MTETLSSFFQKSRGAPIERDGSIIRPSFRLSLDKGIHEFTLHRLSAKSMPLQGVRLNVKNGDIAVNGMKLRGVVMWASSSPEKVEFSVASNSNGELIIWNAWEIDGLTQASVGNAGVVVEQKNDCEFLVSCSDGTGAIDFSCLVIQIERRR